MINFVDEAELSGTRRTRDGYLVADVRCARTGVQIYDAAELGLPGRTGPVRVYRPEPAVFSKASMATYAGKPVTVDHPPVAVDSANWREYAVGEVGEEVARDGEYVRVPMRVMDQAAIEAVQNGKKQVSMGYTTPLLEMSGQTPDGETYDAVQTGPIEINHLAIVAAARGGEELRIGDDASNWGAAPEPTKREDDMPDQLRSIVVDGLTVQTTDQGAQAIEKLQKQVTDAQSELEARDSEIATLKNTVETRDGEVSALKKQLADAQSPAALDAAVRARAAVVAAAKRHGVTSVESMTDAEIRRAVVSKAMGDAASREMSDAAVEGAFAALSATPRTDAPLRVDASPAEQHDGGWSRYVSMKKEA